jgi:hypothetical protein
LKTDERMNAGIYKGDERGQGGREGRREGRASKSGIAWEGKEERRAQINGGKKDEAGTNGSM